MEVILLKHGYSLVIIILLLLTIPGETDHTEKVENNNSSSIELEGGVNIHILGDKDGNSDEGDEGNSDEGKSDEGDGGNSDEDDEEEGLNTIEEEGARKPPTFNWPSGVVPYLIKTQDFDRIIAGRIRTAMNTIMSSSCVVFRDMSRSAPRPRNAKTPWLSIENPEGVRECSHPTVREEGRSTKSTLIVGYDCMGHRDIMHGLLHALGFEDEVTHPQRDQYIRVVWQNIQPKYRSLFYLKKREPTQKVVEYDSMSVMHFHDRAYTINGGATIVPRIPGLLIAPSDTLSQLDVMKLRLLFGHECNKRKVANLLRTCQNALRVNSTDDDDEDQLNDGSGTNQDWYTNKPIILDNENQPTDVKPYEQPSYTDSEDNRSN
ncbi:hypothetical protein PYW07_008347 [Mythimna separata]|uniref:Metalloendopeptidase n=1 Tax=Mythimna separata TaxID=271217 RepID=A0AAD8DMS2_MYTSE|nr:hypothetical protein PYW07_008347 [Mythimna separata]